MSTLLVLKNDRVVLSGRMLREDEVVRDRWFKRRFEDFVSQIPNHAGSCVVFGVNGKESVILDVVHSGGKLRQVIRSGMKKGNGEDITRYMWMKNLLVEKKFESIEVQMVVRR